MQNRGVLLIGFICLIFVSKSVSQGIYQISNSYPFIELYKNNLQFYGDSSQFNTVFQKIDSLAFLGKGKLSILHIGGSHVQGGTLQRTLRSKFNNIVPGIGGERGFFFPYKMAHSNMPTDYNVEFTGEWTGSRCTKKSSVLYF